MRVFEYHKYVFATGICATIFIETPVLKNCVCFVVLAQLWGSRKKLGAPYSNTHDVDLICFYNA